MSIRTASLSAAALLALSAVCDLAAQRGGTIRYQGREFPARMQSQLARWEKGAQ